jgi:inhibitor of KinA
MIPIQQLNSNLEFYFLSEEAITIQFGNTISEEIFDKINAFNQLIEQHPFVGFKTAVVAYTTLTVFYAPTEVIHSKLQGITCFDKISNYLNQIRLQQEIVKETKPNTIEIPVCYGDKFGPDLTAIAKHCKLTPNQVIKMHSEAIYTVYMIGFVPGFAYMGGMNERLAMPRKTQPSKAVPAGAVGIAGKQTGIYPLTTPGGWQILGQTPLTLFSLHQPQPSLLKAGDKVIFKPINLAEFKRLSAKPDAD